MTLALAQRARKVKAGYWDWSIWLAGARDELAEVRSVTYQLHPTFPQPVRERTDPADAFRLDARGWGEFRIMATVSRADGSRVDLQHWLTLGGDERGRAVETTAGERVYLAHAAVDKPVADAVKAALITNGFDVVTDADMGVGRSVSAEITRLIEGADRVVAVVTDSTGPWVRAELNLASSFEHPVTVIGVGGSLPDWADPDVGLKPGMPSGDIAGALRGRING